MQLKRLLNNQLFISLIGLISILVYYIPCFILGENSFILIHDGLDCEYIFRILINLPEQSPYFNNGIVWQSMGGIPRDMLISNLNISSFFFKVFDPFFAYVANDFFARTVAFIGMYLLIIDYIIIRGNYRFIYAAILAVIFAVLGGNTIYGSLTVMGQPILLWAILNIYCNKSKFNYLIVFLFPFCSLLYLSGIFICIIISIVFIYLYFFQKDQNATKLLPILIILSLAYFVVEYRMIASLLANDFTSHRIERSLVLSRSILDIFKFVINLFINTQYHTGKFLTIPIILLVILCTIYKKRSKILSISIITIIVLYFIIFVINILLNYFNWAILNAFQWDRFYFLFPCLWFIILAESINLLTNTDNIKITKIHLIVLLSISVLFSNVLFNNWELRNNVRSLMMQDVREPNYKQFFDKELFNSIKLSIGQPLDKYRVASIGLHPAVAIKNGFFTVDGYFTSYPLSYKHKFRNVIKNELEKDNLIKSYFDDWGNRCYIFSSELKKNYLISKKNPLHLRIENLNIDTYYLSNELECKFLFSSLKIENYKSLNLTEFGVFTTQSSFWKIYVYQIQ